MLVVRFEAPPDRYVQFTALSVAPLPYQSLPNRKLVHKPDYEVTFQAKDINQNLWPDFIQDEVVVNLKVNFHRPVTMFALLPGGWLPTPMVTSGYVFIDQNITIELEQIKVTLTQDAEPDKVWWLNWFANSDIRINPLLVGFEGDKGSLPTFDELKLKLRESRRHIRRHLPHFSIVTHTPRDLRTMHEMLESLRLRNEREVVFLKNVANLIRFRPGPLETASKESAILEEAHRCGVSLTSLVVIAALSCIYESLEGGVHVGRKVIKPTQSYDDAAAHNALSDLRNLELLMASAHLEHDKPVALLTKDLNLARFWCALGYRSAAWDHHGRTFTMSFAPSMEMFPRLDQQQTSALIDRLLA